MATAQVSTDDPSKRNVKVFIQRDYSRGTACRFQNKFPPELEGKLERSQFEQTVNHINEIFDEAEEVGPRTYLEGCLGCVTAYLIFMCIQTQYNKCLKRLAEYINEQNQSVFVPRGLMITNPMDRGLRVIEIVVVSSSDQR
ncbi:golgin subfamily A member 7-like [Stylophora pistillata]|uniref:Ras modification protein ERF4 n=1 Tax=Stylophora pistillata TaxID=50429 RepID=A0A2B4SEX4_STYPI|nr:golgin subfamily A member 7-like [Stylophora pistillata]PFX28411.1 Golgin subfamily A member 7B [Stylophora pistillata]